MLPSAGSRRRALVRTAATSTVVAGLVVAATLSGSPHATTAAPARGRTATPTMPMEAVPASAFVASAPDLPRDGWTERADSTAGAHPAAYVADNGPGSAWVSGAGRGVHQLVIDTGRRQPMSGLRLTPAADAGLEIGRYRVATSTDGRQWVPATSGLWAPDRTVQKADFAVVRARYVRLTARPASGGPGAVGVDDVRLVGTPTYDRPLSQRVDADQALAHPPAARRDDPGSLGQWTDPIGLPIVPVSAVLLPHDKVMTFSGYKADAYDGTGRSGYTQVSFFDLGTDEAGQRTVSNTHHEMFCTGLSVLGDGRVVITGGSNASNTTIYDPRTDRFSIGPQMHIPRGYQSSVTLSDGRVFTLGGSWSGGRGGKDGEVMNAAATRWTRLPRDKATVIYTHDHAGVFRRDNHAWLFAGDNGKVFQAGPSSHMHWFGTHATGAVKPAGPRGSAPDEMNGTAVMYDNGKILTQGGATSYDQATATKQAYTIDISRGPKHPVKVHRVQDVQYPRTFANSVVLPDGSVLTTGGQTVGLPFSDEGSVLTSLLWSPATEQFRELAPQAVPRNYHSWSLLLPDGRVMSGGGGLCGDCETNHPDVEIFTPPYLFNADGSPRSRPQILGKVPGHLRAGSSVTVRASRPIATWSLIRTGSATHSVDTDQRRIRLHATALGGGRYRLDVPGRRGTTVPGSYLLFAVDEAGTPSQSRWVVLPPS